MITIANCDSLSDLRQKLIDGEEVRTVRHLEQEPCEDAISRQAVKEQMIKYGFHAPDMTVTEFVEDLPPVTPQKIGHWEYVQYDYNSKLGDWRCSECRSVVIECVDKNDKGGIPLYKYCPQCGVKIQEVEN